MSSHKCQSEIVYPACCKQQFDFVADSHVLVAEDCDKLKSQFGQSIALSSDGKILVVGAPVLAVDGVSNYGAAFVYERQRALGASVKTPEFKLLQRLDADAGNPSLMGYRVAISGNGQRIAVSAVNRDNNELEPAPTSGVVFIYDLGCKGGKSNYNLVQKVYAQTFIDEELTYDNPGSGNFGECIALSFDGRVLVATISTVNIPLGKVYIYEDKSCPVLKTGCCIKPKQEPLFVFRQNMDRTKLFADSGITSILGIANCVTTDAHGDTIAIGCKEAEGSSGRVLIYKRVVDESVWQWNQNLASPTPANGGRFGVSIDITPDGSRLAVENNDNTLNPPRGYGVVFYRPDAASQYNVEAVLPGAAPDFNFFPLLLNDVRLITSVCPFNVPLILPVVTFQTHTVFSSGAAMIIFFSSLLTLSPDRKLICICNEVTALPSAAFHT